MEPISKKFVKNPQRHQNYEIIIVISCRVASVLYSKGREQGTGNREQQVGILKGNKKT